MVPVTKRFYQKNQTIKGRHSFNYPVTVSIMDEKDTPPKRTGRGGARPNSGRKPKEVTSAQKTAQAAIAKAARVAKQVAAVEVKRDEVLAEVPLVVAVATARKRIGERYPEILDALFTLMEGGKQVTRKWELAGLIQVDEWTDPDEKGKQAKVKRQLFPDMKPDAMVLVMQQEVTYPPDAATTQFLFNRLAGKPAEEKTDPLSDAPNEGAKVTTREEMYADLLDMMFARWEQRNAPPPAQALAPALAMPIEGSSA